MTWAMIGHEWAATLLKKHLRAGRVRHAYLISGEDGLGKRTLAIRFAQALNCTAESMSGEICGVCRPCTAIPAGQFPDLHLMEPEPGSANLKVEQVRELQGQLALTPYESRWRIALLPDFERASESAANALLKTLEEPGEHVVVILTALDAGSLLPTIVSRCEHLPLRAVSKATLQQALLQLDVREDQTTLIAGLAQGRPGWALRYARDPSYLEQRSARIDQLRQLLQLSRRERFDLIDAMLSRKDDLDTQRRTVLGALQVWMDIWRDAMQQAFNPEVELTNVDQAELVKDLSSRLRAGQLHVCVRALQRTQHAIERYANIRLAMEVLMLDLPHL